MITSEDAAIHIVGFDVGLTCMGMAAITCCKNRIDKIHKLYYVKCSHTDTTRELADYSKKLKKDKNRYGGTLTYLNEIIYQRINDTKDTITKFIDEFIVEIPKGSRVYMALEQPFLAGTKMVRAFQKQTLLSGYLTYILRQKYPTAFVIGVENRSAKLASIKEATRNKDKIVAIMEKKYTTLKKHTESFSKESKASSIEAVMIAYGALDGISFLTNKN